MKYGIYTIFYRETTSWILREVIQHPSKNSRTISKSLQNQEEVYAQIKYHQIAMSVLELHYICVANLVYAPDEQVRYLNKSIYSIFQKRGYRKKEVIDAYWCKAVFFHDPLYSSWRFTMRRHRPIQRGSSLHSMYITLHSTTKINRILPNKTGSMKLTVHRQSDHFTAPIKLDQRYINVFAER